MDTNYKGVTLKRVDLENAISDIILSFGYEVHENYDTMTTSDLQGRAEVVAKDAISQVAQFIENTDYDLEDLK